jgi:hypothetical protein
MTGFNSEEITVALTGSVAVAPYSPSLVLPSSPTAALDPAFKDLGYTTEDGSTFTVTPNVQDITAWQKRTPVRRIVTARDVTVAFVLEQLNLDTFALGFGGGDWTEPTAGTYRYDPPADGDALAEYALVLGFADGDKHGRLVMYKGTINEAVEMQLVANNSANIPVTLASLTPDDEDASWYFLSDDEAFATS